MAFLQIAQSCDEENLPDVRTKSIQIGKNRIESIMNLFFQNSSVQWNWRAREGVDVIHPLHSAKIWNTNDARARLEGWPGTGLLTEVYLKAKMSPRLLIQVWVVPRHLEKVPYPKINLAKEHKNIEDGLEFAKCHNIHQLIVHLRRDNSIRDFLFIKTTDIPKEAWKEERKWGRRIDRIYVKQGYMKSFPFMFFNKKTKRTLIKTIGEKLNG